MRNSGQRNNRKQRIGTVKSNLMKKTITVVVERVSHHPVYDRLIRGKSSFKVHDEKNEAKVGDTVKIEETRPISKTKRWRLVEILKKL